MNNDLIQYYKARAEEYERIYLKPERQEDIASSAKILCDLFQNRSVVEIACGTGFWTSHFAKAAHSVFATDINLAVIEIARQKKISNPNVKFEVKDLYNFEPEKKFQSLFGGFIWSHIPVQDLDLFFETINKLVDKNGTVVLMDNLYVEGSNLPVTEKDEQGNTYQARKLDDGSTHRVLKNFATESFLKEKLKERAVHIKFISLNYFWILSYQPVSK